MFVPAAILAVCAGEPGLSGEFRVHDEAELTFERELLGVTASEVYRARAIHCAERVVIVLACPTFEPPVVGEHSVGHVSLDGEHFLAAPDVGIVEDADAYLRNRVRVPALSQ